MKLCQSSFAKYVAPAFSLALSFTSLQVLGQTYNPTASDSYQNTAGGSGALTASTGYDTGNTAFGYAAMASNNDGNANSAFGASALQYADGGSNNTAIGAGALENNGGGDWNTATGFDALMSNKYGSYNTADGSGALGNNVGSNNTATGYEALSFNTSGTENTADGAYALHSNSTGYSNMAGGYEALYYNTTGYGNMAEGAHALGANTTGNGNTAFGATALHNLSSGNANIGFGYEAGENLTTGTANIDIGNSGVAGDTQTIRLGSTQTAAYIAGINGVTVSGGSEVLINSNGQLGTVQSSARYKRDIRDIGGDSAKLARLRPVSFTYKADPSQEKQYGLIAEDVAQVYPELVAHSADGQVQTVQYHKLVPMLLNEVQKQGLALQQKDAQIEALQQQKDAQQQQITALASRLDALARQVADSGSIKLAVAGR